MTIPAFGLGTFRLKDDVVIASVKTALELGYRAVDTAQIYDNEAAVGQAITESGVPRSELYITTKIWIENLSKDKLIPSLKESLKKLRTDYVDLTLIHWPSPGDAVSVEEFMLALLEAKKQGLTREIGISNFTIPLMKRLLPRWAQTISPPTRLSYLRICRIVRWLTGRKRTVSTSPLI